MPGDSLTRRGRWLGPLAATVVVLGLWMAFAARPGPEEATELAPATRTAERGPEGSPGSMRADMPRGTPAAMGAPASPEPRELWRHRLERAEQTLQRYREATRYPPESRPIEEHPDRIHPGAPIARELPINKRSRDEGGGVHLQLEQERLNVVGDEAVRLSVACVDRTGATQRCRILSAVAAVAPYLDEAAVHPEVPIRFEDDGRGGDAVANDWVFSTSFQPERQGFARFHGIIRVTVQLTLGDEQGAPFFDLLYTPSPPAELTGAVRESLEGGALALHVAVQVRRAGRYVVEARVDDAMGQPFALVTFNDELAEGVREIPLRVFGKLLRDRRPPQPLRLRDVEGFLLKEDADPDREVMRPYRGVMHVARAYPEHAFSDSEWQSEERDRYLAELTRDVEEASETLAR